MELTIDGRPIEVSTGESLRDLVVRLGLDTNSLKTRPLAADIKGEIFTLNYIPIREQESITTTVRMRRAIRASKGVINLIGYGDPRGKQVYERTMQFVFFLAVRQVFPQARVKVDFAIGAGIYIEIDKETPLTANDVHLLKQRCDEIVKSDFPLLRKRVDIDEAIDFFERDGQQDKVRLLEWRKFTYFDVYRHDDYVDYFYGEMMPSTGYVSVFDLQFHAPGLYLVRPDNDDFDRPATEVDLPKFASVFEQSDRWGKLMHCETVADLNDLTTSGKLRELIRVNEALHERRFSEIASEIVHRGAMAILIAGPSSSGKTTSANRLATQLRVLGKSPILLSLDDYYIDRRLIEPDQNGKVDLEHINTIDVPQFNADLEELLNGKTVEIPHFDFKSGSRQMLGHYVTLSDDTPLIIEGLHALNPTLLNPRIDHSLIFRLYVSALTTLNLDNHNRIPTTDVRLLRRMVRDYETRGATMERTLDMWESVRKGEERWIFPYQEGADAIFNTSLVYELAVLKKHIYPLLTEISPDNPCYDQIRHIIKFLNYIHDANVEDEIPPTSILREFVGGNTFYR
ncbi:MAG: nucleoside kinase [Eubacteriales bacterium]|nr:nucleoside kinase [Eubacteriales bacterium]